MPADPVRSLAAALADAAGAELVLERPGEPEHGDYATNVALQLAGTRRRPPREIAAEIAAAAAGLEAVDRAEVAGPGFVNLFLRDGWFASALAGILEDGDAYGADGARERERVQVEMVSANPTGPLHVALAQRDGVRPLHAERRVLIAACIWDRSGCRAGRRASFGSSRRSAGTALPSGRTR